ncbi:MAG TPA: YhjD/YihY/BrkB family envelope integrity protein [Gaiellaceae bacterium]|nr:YhjD/YihY/BrkB family envelope integrity protein [Gaiellaceae bacterium]
MGRLYNRFDSFQQRHGWLAFPLAVRQKYSEDQGGYLAATIAYYGFFSIFPLLLVATTTLGFVLRGHPALESRIVGSALGQFPVIGHELHVRSLHGDAFALVFGIAAALWAGMGAVLAAENAMNQLWGVPFKHRPDFFRARARALVLLLLLGGGVLAATALAGAGSVGASYGVAWKVASIIASVCLDFVVFWVALRLLTARSVSWSNLRGGAAAAALAYEALQLLGGYYVGHTLRHADSLYGTFGLVLGLLSFIYLAAHALLLAAEGNVVAVRRLWPRSFSVVFEQPATRADQVALTQRGKIEERRQDEHVQIDIPVEDD